MEVKYNVLINKDNEINFTLKENDFNGIYVKEYSKIISLIQIVTTRKTKITINGKELNDEQLKAYKNKISVITNYKFYNNYHENLYQLMLNEIRNKKIVLKNTDKKIKDSLKIVGLDTDLLKRNIKTLSSSEKTIVKLAISLLSNPNVIIIEEPFKNLDKQNTKRIYMLLQRIKDQYKKTIVFLSQDSDLLYYYTKNLIIFKNEKIIVEGPTETVYQRVDFLRRKRINIPKIVEFTYIAKKKKNVKIDYHKDVRDIIKDIYKHV